MTPSHVSVACKSFRYTEVGCRLGEEERENGCGKFWRIVIHGGGSARTTTRTNQDKVIVVKPRFCGDEPCLLYVASCRTLSEFREACYEVVGQMYRVV